MPGWDGWPGQLHPSLCPRDVGAAVLLLSLGSPGSGHGVPKASPGHRRVPRPCKQLEQFKVPIVPLPYRWPGRD